jgi:CRP/FNR family transcriptional regulator
MGNKGIVDIALPGGMELIEDGKQAQHVLCDMLKNVKGLEVFDQAELEFLASHMRAYRVKSGATLFREGDRNSHLSVLIEGRVGVYKEDSNDEVKFFATISPGRIFGEISVIDNLPYSASIIAESDATIITMSRDSFRRCVETRPSIGVRLLTLIAALLCARLRSVSDQLVDFIDV